MMRHALTLLLLAACTDETGIDDIAEVEQAGSSYQGSSYQGSSYQGSSYQGSSYQGSSYQGSSYQGSSYQGANYGGLGVTGSIVDKTTLETWRRLKTGYWEQRLPDRTCTWNSLRSILVSCTVVNLNTTASPLAGLTFPTTFTDAAGVPRAGNVRIKSGVGMVKKDSTTLAMHPLDGTGAPGSKVYGGECTNPNGCRYNGDLWLYQVELVDTNNVGYQFCADGGKAFAIAGLWSKSGGRSMPHGQFTFACTAGTIAKCTRWGYRPFGSATKANGQTVPMADYHQTCIRAAAADYCASGKSYTKDGTLVDIYDYQPQQGNTGFIPRTLSLTLGGISTSFVWESTFDPIGGTELDFQRYQELGSLYSDCDAFSLGTAPVPNEYHIPMMRDVSTWTTPRISIDSTVGCSHSEETLGRGLHPQCSKCTYHLWEAGLGGGCLSSSPGAWTESCRQTALANCHSPALLGIYPRMALHSECTAGSGLSVYDSACTMNICDPNPANTTRGCCGAGGWTSACVAAANARCKNGREGSNMFGDNIGFCGTTIPPVIGGGIGGIGGGGGVAHP